MIKLKYHYFMIYYTIYEFQNRKKINIILTYL